jgi:hypothetical protein
MGVVIEMCVKYPGGRPRNTGTDMRRRTEIIPVKDPYTRIKPFTLASGHGRYITVTSERAFFPLGNGR